MTVRDDYKTILDNHVFSNNANLSSQPHIHFISADIAASDKGNGIITIADFREIQVDETYNKRDTHYNVLTKISFRGQTTDVKIMAILDEIQNAYDTNNNTGGRTYYVKKLNHDWNGLVKDVEINLFNLFVKEFEAIV